MTYNEAEIKRRINGRRQSFLTKMIAWLLLDSAAVITAAIIRDVTVVFIAVVIVIASAFYMSKTIRRYRPLILFRGEVKGINIKEHEFVVTNKRPTFSARIVMPKRNTSSFTGGKTRTKPPTSAIVYLRLGDGNVTYIEHLTNAQTDIYEIGDTLYKYSGARYPIILGKEVKAMPCPLCGTANKCTEDRCITCGLKIEN